jgi:peptidoglycan/LPS O-acetylase OafA/YrhL
MSIIATYAIAMLSWNLLEKPFLKLKRFFEAKQVEVEAIAA